MVVYLFLTLMFLKKVILNIMDSNMYSRKSQKPTASPIYHAYQARGKFPEIT